MSSGSVPEELLVPLLRWGMAPGLALAVCPAQATFKKVFPPWSQSLFVKKKHKKKTTPKQNPQQEGEYDLLKKKKKKAIFLASHFLSSLCYYCRYVFE